MVYCNTEFFTSPLKIVGTYRTEEEAIKRIETQPSMKPMEQNFCGPLWRNDTHSLQYYIRKYPLGDSDCTHRGV
jgi:hypothetical protein